MISTPELALLCAVFLAGFVARGLVKVIGIEDDENE